MPEGIFNSLIGAALLRKVGALHRGTQANAQGLGTQLSRNQAVCLLGELPGLGLRDAGQVIRTQVSQGAHWPVIGLAGVRVDAIGDELLADPQHFDGRVLESGKRLHGPVDQQALGCMANADCRCIAQHPLGECLHLERDGGRIEDVDVNADHPARGNADAGFGPVAPDVDLVVGGVTLAMSAPLGVLVPSAKLVQPRLLGVGLNRQDRKAAIDQGGAQLRHVILVCHGAP